MKCAYYNENDPYAAQWLRNLIAARLVADGEVDDRSIVDVRAGDLAGFNQVHLFAGIGGWSHALRLFGVGDNEPTWTGSCPCQPFSSAGKGRGIADERHLWPEMFRLVSECRPTRVFGEQVASRAGREWLSGVRADLEELGYAVGAADLCAAGEGAPHIRQRLFWVADATSERRARLDSLLQRGGEGGAETSRSGAPGGMADTECSTGISRWPANECRGGFKAASIGSHAESGRRGATSRLGEPDREGPQGLQFGRDSADQRTPWAASVAHLCRDGKRKRIPVEPEFFPLAHGVPARVGRLRAYGNAIVPQVAATFIRAALSVMP